MKHPEEIVEEVLAQLTTDTFILKRGTRPEQNFDADEIDFNQKNGVVFMDPVKLKGEVQATNFRTYKCPISLFFAYKSNLEDPTVDQYSLVKKARAAADEFLLRIQKHEKIEPQKVLKHELDDVYNLFDLNLSGAFLTVEVIVRNNDASCLA